MILKTWEVFKIALGNPNAKFKRVKDNTIVLVDKDGQLKAEGNTYSYPLPKANDDWELVREEVDFMTAVNSGKKIHPVCHTIDGFLKFNQWDLNLEMINGKWIIE